MTIEVAYLSEDEIEDHADCLLAEYRETAGRPVTIPVPVAEITTYHLALQLGFADLHQVLGVPRVDNEPDILGAIWVNDEAVLIDQSLDPNKNPMMLGRYRFSVAHEIGHWRLHRSYVVDDTAQGTLLDAGGKPTVICRTSEAKERIEWQADFFGSCLLMPRALILQEWKAWRGSYEPIIFEKVRHCRFAKRPSRLGPRGLAEILSDAESDQVYLFRQIANQFAPLFGVSNHAMRIKLEKLGLLRRDLPRQSTLV